MTYSKEKTICSSLFASVVSISHPLRSLQLLQKVQKYKFLLYSLPVFILPFFLAFQFSKNFHYILYSHLPLSFKTTMTLIFILLFTTLFVLIFCSAVPSPLLTPPLHFLQALFSFPKKNIMGLILIVPLTATAPSFFPFPASCHLQLLSVFGSASH